MTLQASEGVYLNSLQSDLWNLRNLSNKIKKDLCNVYGKHCLKITIEANKKIANFFDVSLNLSNGKHMPYNKPNNISLYIYKKSNHPPRIISNIDIYCYAENKTDITSMLNTLLHTQSNKFIRECWITEQSKTSNATAVTWHNVISFILQKKL